MTLTQTQIRRYMSEIAHEAEAMPTPRTLDLENRRVAREQKRTGIAPIGCITCPLFDADEMQCAVFIVLRESCRTGEVAKQTARMKGASKS